MRAGGRVSCGPRLRLRPRATRSGRGRVSAAAAAVGPALLACGLGARDRHVLRGGGCELRPAAAFGSGGAAGRGVAWSSGVTLGSGLGQRRAGTLPGRRAVLSPSPLGVHMPLLSLGRAARSVKRQSFDAPGPGPVPALAEATEGPEPRPRWRACEAPGVLTRSRYPEELLRLGLSARMLPVRRDPSRSPDNFKLGRGSGVRAVPGLDAGPRARAPPHIHPPPARAAESRVLSDHLPAQAAPPSLA
jgi:hypothetical protein